MSHHNVHLITFDCHAAAQRLPTVISISLARSFFLFKEMKWKSLRERTPTCPADRILRHVAVYIYEKKKNAPAIQCTWSRRRATILHYFRVFYLMCWNDLIIDLNKIHRLWNIDGYNIASFGHHSIYYYVTHLYKKGMRYRGGPIINVL